MKKILAMIIFLAGSVPALAVCSVTGGACSLLDSSTINERYVPNHLENLSKPDAFAPKYVTPYQDMLINTETNSSATGGASNTNDYNSNCQFGVCLPGENYSE